MNHYTVRAIKGKRCVRRVDSWTIVNARNIYERLLSEFPERSLADGSSNAPESGSWRVLAFPKKLQN